MSVVYAQNPATSLNSFLSAFRNNILSSSVAIAMYGFSKTFSRESSVTFTKIVSICIFIVSFCIGMNTIYAHYDYIRELEKDKDNLPPYVNLNAWYNHMYIAMGYNVIVLIILVLACIRFYSAHPQFFS